jgi:hypothetical protein
LISLLESSNQALLELLIVSYEIKVVREPQVCGDYPDRGDRVDCPRLKNVRVYIFGCLLIPVKKGMSLVGRLFKFGVASLVAKHTFYVFPEELVKRLSLREE